MPRYDFQCKTCGETFEEIRSFATATDPAPCPSCGLPSPRLLRMPTLVRSSFSAPDPAASAGRAARPSDSQAGESTEPLDPTKPNAAWQMIGDGCPCCAGGRHVAPQPQAAPTGDRR